MKNYRTIAFSNCISVFDDFILPVAVGNQSAGLPTEVLFSNNITNQAPTPNPVTLQFRYSLAKLEITVAGFSATDLADMSVRIEGVYTQAGLQLTNGTFANHSGKQTITMHRTGGNATSASFAALVLPTNEEITFLFDANGVVNSYTKTVNFAAAHLHRLNFNFDLNSGFPETTLMLLNATIIPREVNTQNVSASGTPSSVVINGVRWATRNVGAPGTFVQNPEDAGMLFQWNRRVGWASTGYGWPDYSSMPGWDNTIPTGTAWYAENDPCPVGWRVPTYTELRSLRDVGSVWITHNGVNGRLFGVAPNQLFLPAAGFRGAYGTLYHAGTGGFYGSSAAAPQWRLIIAFTGNYFTAGDISVNGFSVRCVAD